MGKHEPRTAAEDLADTLDALAVARDALRETLGHVERIIQSPADPAGVAHQARRTARIAVASLDEAGGFVREGRVHLTGPKPSWMRRVMTRLKPTRREQSQLRSVS